MVQKTLHGMATPVHVRICITSTSQTVVCEGLECNEILDIHIRSAVNTFTCAHVKAAMNNVQSRTVQVQLTETSLDKFASNDIISDSSCARIKQLKSATSGKHPLAVIWSPNSIYNCGSEFKVHLSTIYIY